MAELIYYCGTMDSGKSTLALQTAHNHETRGRNGLVFTNRDRAGEGLISSRLGLQKSAIEVDSDLNIHRLTIEDEGILALYYIYSVRGADGLVRDLESCELCQ